MKKIYPILTVLFLLSSVYGFEHNITCIDTNTLYDELIVYHYINGVFQETEKWNSTKICAFGCKNALCTNENIDYTAPLIFIFVGALFGYFSFKLKGDYAVLQMLFLPISILFILISVSVTVRYLESSSISDNVISILLRGNTIIIWVIVLILAWFLVMFLKNIVIDFIESNQQKKFKRK